MAGTNSPVIKFKSGMLVCDSNTGKIYRARLIDNHIRFQFLNLTEEEYVWEKISNGEIHSMSVCIAEIFYADLISTGVCSFIIKEMMGDDYIANLISM